MGERAVVSPSVDVFIVSENRLLRETLAKVLRNKVGIGTTVASSFSGNLVQQVADAQVQVLLLDPGRAIESTIQLVKEARAAIPALHVIGIGMEPDLQTFLRYVEAGIAGYVLKDASGSDVAQATLSVASGLAVCPANLCLSLFQYVARQSRPNPDFRTRPRSRLTRREQQLMTQVRSGSTNKEIAAELNLSEQTVKNHIHRIMRKLGAPDRLSAAETWSSQTGFSDAM